MSAHTFLQQPETEVIVNDLDNDKLAALKAKLQQKASTDMPPTIIAEKKRSIKMGVLGSGQAGTKLAESFHLLGYPAIAVNTALQDLDPINIPAANKLHLKFGLGGAGKDLDIGHDAAEAYRDSIADLVFDRFENVELVIFTCSLGGGSGAGSVETIVDILANTGKPVAVITVLPQSTDDVQTKQNAIVTLSKLTKLAQTSKIHNLIVVDNARIETIFKDVSQLNFFKVANDAIVHPIDAFNTFSAQTSSVKPLDSTEFGKLFTDGQGLSIYGFMDVENYTEETAIAESVVENLSGTLLASGFNLKQSRYVGVIFAASQKVWDSIPNSSINYAMHMINESCGTPLGVFKGIYVTDSKDDSLRVYSMFSGLGLPDARIEQLKSETKEQKAKIDAKDEQRNMSLKIDTGEETISQADRVRKMIANKKSAFGKLHANAVTDRRKP